MTLFLSGIRNHSFCMLVVFVLGRSVNDSTLRLSLDTWETGLVWGCVSPGAKDLIQGQVAGRSSTWDDLNPAWTVRPFKVNSSAYMSPSFLWCPASFPGRDVKENLLPDCDPRLTPKQGDAVGQGYLAIISVFPSSFLSSCLEPGVPHI